MHPSESQSGVFVLNEHGSVTLEIKKPSGGWVKVFYTSDPHGNQITIKDLSPHYRPEGIPLEDLVPDSIEENQGLVALSALKIRQHITEIGDEFENVIEIIQQHKEVTEPGERAAAGVT